MIAGAAAHQPEDGQEPHLEHPDEAADREPHPGGGLRGPQRARLDARSESRWCGRAARVSVPRRPEQRAGVRSRAGRRAAPAPWPSAPGRRRPARPRARTCAARAASARPRARARRRSRRSASARGARGWPALRPARRAARRSARAVRGALSGAQASQSIIRRMPCARTRAARPIPATRRGPDLTAVAALRTMPRMTRRRLPVVAVVLALVLAAPRRRGRLAAVQAPGAALAVPHVSQARTGAVAIDLADRRDGLLRARRAPARARLEREARDRLRRAGRARPGFRIDDRRARARRAGRHDLAREPRARRPRRPDALERGPRRAWRGRCARPGSASVTGGVFGDESFFDARRTGAGLEVVVLRQRVARRSRR